MRMCLRNIPEVGVGGEDLVPRDEGKIGVGDLVADECAGASAGKVRVDHADDALDLVGVALDGRGNILGMIPGEPRVLAPVWT